MSNYRKKLSRQKKTFHNVSSDNNGNLAFSPNISDADYEEMILTLISIAKRFRQLPAGERQVLLAIAKMINEKPIEALKKNFPEYKDRKDRECYSLVCEIYEDFKKDLFKCGKKDLYIIFEGILTMLPDNQLGIDLKDSKPESSKKALPTSEEDSFDLDAFVKEYETQYKEFRATYIEGQKSLEEQLAYVE